MECITKLKLVAEAAAYNLLRYLNSVLTNLGGTADKVNFIIDKVYLIIIK
ncbi:UNVERIFIED_CONTAM: hypothetical protein Cloal_3877 [Acetivibrio alkalicellulosi]